MTSEEDVEDFLAHFGVKGMKWGVRRGSSSSPDFSEKKGLSPGAKKALTASAVAVGGAAVLVGGFYASRALGGRQVRMGSSESRLAIESGEKVVSRLISSASSRPAFSVSASGIARKTGHNALEEAGRLRRKVDKFDFSETVNFLRNESNVSLREGNARYLGDLTTKLMNDPNVSSSEASKIFAATNEIINKSLRYATQ